MAIYDLSEGARVMVWVMAVLLATGCAEKEAEMRKVMVSPLAGQWFQDSEQALRYEIAEQVRDVSVVRRRGVCAAVVPHAGYRYSGRVAGGVYLRIDPKGYDRIVVMGPSHYVAMPNEVSVPEATHFRTPLGELRSDGEFVARLRGLPFVVSRPEAHAREHGDQIQLPLIQACLATNVPVVCVVCGQFDAKHLVAAAGQLRELLDERTLVVASSDFTHYGANFGYMPFTKDVQANIESLDMGVFELFARKDLAGFLRYLEETGATVCGRDPLAFLVAMMPEDAKVEKTGYDTSGRMTRDEKHSVSYVGALVAGSWKSPARRTSVAVPSAEPVPEEDCARLLELARETIAEALAEGRTRPVLREPKGLTEGMKAVRGGFVTLNKKGGLRGCIGEIVPRREIWKVVREQAVNAAFNDPRFPPLEADELKDVEIEISMLTPPRPVGSWEEIEVGRHGVVLTKGRRSAVFLPQVAPEQGWGREEMVGHLAVKAGLPPEGWRSGADFLVFEAQVARER